MLIPSQVLDTQEDSSKWLLYQIEPGSMKTVFSVFLYHIYACAAVKRMCVPPQNSYMNTRSPMGWCEQAGPLGEVRPRDRDPRERD